MNTNRLNSIQSLQNPDFSSQFNVQRQGPSPVRTGEPSPDILNLFSPAIREKPRFMALAAALLKQVNDMLTLVQSGYPEGWSLDTAVGAQLDGIGVLLNTPRPEYSTSDEDYRFLLRARAAMDHWDGTNETLPEILRKAFPGRTAALIDNQDGTASASLEGDIPFSLREIFPVPAGIQLTAYTRE